MKDPASGRRTLGLAPLLLLVLPLLYGAVFFVLRPSINNDAGFGLRVLESMRAGAPFNVLVEPSSQDIALDTSTFVAAWSPAQYLVPALFQMAGFDLGHAIALAAAFCTCIGILGWFALYRALGFTPLTSFVTCLLIEAFRDFLSYDYQYLGGENMLFAAAPWSALLVWRATTASPLASAGAILAALVLATFAKLSGFIFVTALIAGAVLHQFAQLVARPAAERGQALRQSIAWLASVALSWLVFLLAFYFFWVSRGATAVDKPHVHFYSLASLYFPVVATVFSAFSMGDALGYTEGLLPGGIGWQARYAMLLPVALVVFFEVVRRRGGGGATVFILATCGAYALAFVVLFNSGAAIYLHDRFFRPTSLLLLPCLISALLAIVSRPVRVVGWAFALAFALYGAAAAVKHLAAIGKRPVSALGFRHPVASAGLVAWMRDNFGSAAGDRAGRLVYVMSSEIPLEVRGARVIASEADFEPVEALAARRYRGRVGELFVAIPVTFEKNGKADAILRSFVDYDPARWTRRQIDDRFVVFSQK